MRKKKTDSTPDSGLRTPDSHRVWAEVDRAAVKHNLRAIRKAASGARVLAVLKANAYGHGAIEMARLLVSEGVDCLGVGDSGEALELRLAGIKAPILIVGGIVPGEMPAVVERGIEANLHTVSMAEDLNAEAARQKRVARVQLKIDTGMGRLGMQPFDAVPFLHRLRELKNLKLVGLNTHFSYPYEQNPDFTLRQLERFHVAVEVARRLGYGDVLLHASSSLALFRHPEARFNMVRPGVALWGLAPGDDSGIAKKLKPVLSLKTRVLFIKDVPEGQPIGYNRTYYTSTQSRIATMPVGYNDGYRRSLSNKAEVLINGVRCPVVGLVSMDYLTVDVTMAREVAVGDEVILLGGEGDKRISMETLSGWAQCSPYEISCGMGRRVARVYV
ncbi:MAG: alanine racemase [Planctomycetes bacterium]|nr:alanine racemase [Planctomycetota bacterium]